MREYSQGFGSNYGSLEPSSAKCSSSRTWLLTSVSTREREKSSSSARETFEPHRAQPHGSSCGSFIFRKLY